MLMLYVFCIVDDGTKETEAANRPTQHTLHAYHGNERSTVIGLNLSPDLLNHES